MGRAITPKTTEQIIMATVELIVLPFWLIRKTTILMMAVQIEHITPTMKRMKKR